MKTQIKLCGFTNIADVKYAVSLNIDYLGMIFVDNTPRKINTTVAKEAVKICHDNNVKSVGVFLNHDPPQIQTILENVDLDVLQLHGSELIKNYYELSKEIIKTIHVNDIKDISNLISENNCSYLVDSTDQNMHGGTGSTFDWDIIGKEIAHKVIIAGGLRPNNILNLLRNYSPMGVDTSSGIEKSIGLKDHDLIKDFVTCIRDYDEEKN